MESKIPIGTEVQIPGTALATGILKFVGQVKGKHGIFAGIEIIGDRIAGKNNGDVDGIQYFHPTRPHTGLFLPYVKLLNANLHLESIVASRPPSMSANRSASRSASRSSPIASSPTSIPSSPRGQAMIPQSDLERFNRQLLAQNKELKVKLDRHENEIRERTESLFELQKLLDELENELQSKETRLAKQKANYDQQRDELRDAIRTLESQLQENSRLFEQEIEKLQKEQGEKTQYDEYVASTSKEILGFKTEIIESHKEMDNRAGEIAKLQKQVRKLEGDKVALEKMIVDLEAQLNARDVELANLQDGLLKSKVDTEKEMQKLEAGMALADAKLQEQLALKDKEFRDTTGPLRTQVDDLKQELAKLSVAENTNDDSSDPTSSSSSLLAQQAKREHEQEIRQMNFQHDLDLEAKQDIINSLTKKILELDSQSEQKRNYFLKDITNRTKKPESATSDQNSKVNPISAAPSPFYQPRPHPPTPPFSTRQQPPVSAAAAAPLRRTSSSTQASPIPQQQQAAAQFSPASYGDDDEHSLSTKRSVPKLMEIASNITINENSISQLMDGELMVYIPESKADPAAGREKWCGLCERQGHDSVDCEYF